MQSPALAALPCTAVQVFRSLHDRDRRSQL